ncbi:MAG TPA: TetR/AcrR family transcriptional regulator [Amycolatopsis sp.]|uniref:TetR/AcrR family transcriptional regulator n=1 Tax=Amycolatopsis sp. TaxID=37632 RepID=UPI002B45C138|nr:TetR/AcrR family transcriptional regulator [Amycolatopsis sp.]HKS47615.1 TetR/AcrR family transcriptional regulator [Amycolatopsis sp.]
MNLPVPWRSTEPARPRLSADLIVRTALDILVGEGIDAVTMRRVAHELGTGPASLYAHVANKSELHDLMYDRALGAVEPPKPDARRWRAQVKRLLSDQLAIMLAHPGIARVTWATMIPVGPNVLRQGETLLALLRAGGLSTRRAAYAADALTLYTKAFAYEAGVWSSGELDQAEIAKRGAQTRAYLEANSEDWPNTLGAGELITAETARERFAFGLDIMLRGLTR